VAFREAHEQVGRVVADCEARGIDVMDLSAAQLAEALPELADADAADLLSVDGALRRRDASLGPAPSAVREQLARLRARLA
jgi:argininosuccinate lyase